MIRTSVLRLFLFGLVVFTTPSPARDEAEAPPQWRLSLYGAVANGTGSVLTAGRYGDAWGIRAGAWLRQVHVEGAPPDVFAGVDHLWRSGKWRYGIGVVWIDKENRLNGTRWNFSLSVAYDLSDRYFIELLHFSHGSMAGIEKDADNVGWDLLGLGVAL